MKIKTLEFQVTAEGNQTLYTAKTEKGRFTVLERMTGFGFRQTESGYLDDKNFYLILGDIRDSEMTVNEAIEKFKASDCIAPRK